MKIYFVTSCKPNHDEKVKTRQVNSIKSWKWLNCDKEIFVFNKNPQITEMCDSNYLKGRFNLFYDLKPGDSDYIEWDEEA